jgi:hypothetical protein
LTRAVTIIALTCILVVGAAAAAILGGSSVPDAMPQAVSQLAQNPVTNREAKTDRLAIATLALASIDPAPAKSDAAAPEATQSLRLAFAAQGTSADVAPPQITAPRAVTPAAMPPAPLAPKVVARPVPQKPYALLSDGQIAGIKERLRLSPDQEYYWPGVENALRAVAHRIHANHQANPHATGLPIDADSDEVQQLKSAAMPLLFSLREDQKNEVRTLARLIGLEKVAAQI